jgi:uncharacterized membrane protein
MSGSTPPIRSTWPDRSYWRGFWGRLAGGLVLTLVVMAGWLAAMPASQRGRMLNYWASVRVPAPSWHPDVLMAAPPSVQIHVAGAVFALVIGAVIILLPKGTGFHRLLGWSWVGSMIIVAVTSIVMVADLHTGINPLHVFTALTAISLWAALTGIRRGDVRRHAGSMIGLYVGGLIIAGIFAFIPGRMMWQAVFGG